MENIKCRLCGFVHLQGSCPKVNHSPKLPPADPWDRHTGVKPVTDFKVDCHWIPVNEDWALLRPTIQLYDDTYALAKDVEVYRIKRPTAPELTALALALAWTTKAVGSGGVPVLGMYERQPGHIMEPGTDESLLFRWYAQVGGRLSVAAVRLSGDLSGQVRLTGVE